MMSCEITKKTKVQDIAKVKLAVFSKKGVFDTCLCRRQECYSHGKRYEEVTCKVGIPVKKE